MKRMKRALCLLLALVMMLGMLNISVLAADETVTDTWDGTRATEFAGGDGSQSDPYRIKTGAQLAYLADFVNGGYATRGKYFQLDVDINLKSKAWTPIGTENYGFEGTFMGGGHTISNLTVSVNTPVAGLFGYIANATVCNFTIKTAAVTTSAHPGYAGTFAGVAQGSTLCELHAVNSKVKATHSTTSGAYTAAGGIVGAGAASPESMLLICACSNVALNYAGKSTAAGTVYTEGDSSSAGGIYGGPYGDTAGEVRIERCWTQVMTDAKYGTAGGIAGSDTTSHSKNAGVSLHISDCYNSGAVRVRNTSVANYPVSAGGIVGRLNVKDSSVSRVYSNINGTDYYGGYVGVPGRGGSPWQVSFGGGIVGYVGNKSITFDQCYNMGRVYTTNNQLTDSSQKPNLGRISGITTGTYTNCYYWSGANALPSDSRYTNVTVNSTAVANDSGARTKMETAWTSNNAWFFEAGKVTLPTLKTCGSCGPDCGCSCGEHPSVAPDVPTAPTAPDFDTVQALLGNVTVTCTTADSDHAVGSYALIAENVTMGDAVEGDAENGYTYKVTVQADPYVDSYSSDVEAEHSLAEGEGDKTVTLNWSESAWALFNSADKPVNFNVVHAEATAPSAPDFDTVQALLGNVTVTCTTADSDHAVESYALIAENVTMGDAVEGDAENGYTFQVTVAMAPYVALYNSDESHTGYPTHVAAENEGDKTVTLSRNGSAWVLAAAAVTPVNFNVVDQVTKYTVTTYNGDTKLNEYEVVEGESVTPAAPGAEEGFIFKGWATAKDGEVVYQPDAAITPTSSMELYAIWEPEPELKLEITKTNTGFKLDEQTGNAAVDYTVTVKNASDVDLYGLRLTDTMAADASGDVSYSFRDFKVDGKAITPKSVSEGGMEHVLQLVDRNTAFAMGTTVTLTYTVDIMNNSDDEVSVSLENDATADSWSAVKAAQASTLALRSRVMTLADEDDDAPAVSGSASSGTGGNTGTGTVIGTLPGKYTVSYSWNLPAGATETLPTGGKYPVGATVTVDTAYAQGMEITVGGKVYTFSGWDRIGTFEMPKGNVTISGTWTQVEATYTVEWYDTDGNVLKEAETRTGHVGDTVSVTVDDKAQITKAGSKYVFDAGNSKNVESATLGKTGTVLQLYFKKTAVPATQIEDEDIQVLYLVQWLDEGGKTLKSEMRGPEAIGTAVSVSKDDKAEIKTEDGSIYTFDEDAENVESGVLKVIKSVDDIVILQLYFKKTAVSATQIEDEDIQVLYLVQWLDEGGQVLKSEMRGPEAIGTVVSVDEGDKAEIKTEDGSIYTFDEAAQNVESGVLKVIKSEDDIVILQLYFKKTAVSATQIEDEDIQVLYLVQWLDEGGQVLKSEMRGPEAIGTAVAVGEDDKAEIETEDGSIYTFDEDAENVESGELKAIESVDDIVILQLYFKKTAVPTTPIDEETIQVGYLVQWLDEGGQVLKSEMRGPEAIGTEVSVDEGDKAEIEAEDGSIYTFDEAAQNVESGELKAIESVDDIVILQLYFKKTAVPTTPVTVGDVVRYMVQWLDEKGSELKAADMTRSGKVGETVSVTESDKAIDGYTFDADNENNALSGELKAIKAQGDIVTLKLYFTKNEEQVPVVPVVPTPKPTPDDDPTDDPTDDPIDINDDVPPLAGLDMENHVAYIVGRPGGRVAPLENVTRAEVVTIFFRLMTDEYRNEHWSSVNDYSDVTASTWYNNAVSTASNAGLVRGLPDGTFRGGRYITRAEFATIAARFLGDGDAPASRFTDIEGHWAQHDIDRAVAAGWFEGDGEDSTNFRPNDYIRRAEVMIVINRMLGRSYDAEHECEGMIEWQDNMDKDTWYYEAVQEATNSHDHVDMGTGEMWTEITETRDWSELEK